jgi:hypothetical protein
LRVDDFATPLSSAINARNSRKIVPLGALLYPPLSQGNGFSREVHLLCEQEVACLNRVTPIFVSA